MEPEVSVRGGWLRAWRAWGPLALAAGLSSLELALVRGAGPPGRQLEVLRQLGEVGADPLASLLALLALAAEGLGAYLLAVLGLRLLATLPGVVGWLAAGASLLVAPAAVRRALDLLLGGALLAQATLGPLPARAATAALPGRLGGPGPVAAGPALAGPGLGGSRTPAPLPPWLAERPPAAGGGPAVAARPRRARRPPAATDAEGVRGIGVGGAHTVRPGDTLWGIAAVHLPSALRSPAAIDRYWRQLYGANQAVLGPDPDLIHPGTRLLVPPYRPDRR